MISDTLCEAIDDIRQQLRGPFYEESRTDIEIVVTMMEALRMIFDMSPTDSASARESDLLLGLIRQASPIAKELRDRIEAWARHCSATRAWNDDIASEPKQ